MNFTRKMDTLFTGGASLEPKPPEPLTYSQIRLKFCGEKKIDERLSTTTPKYSNKVLIGNWYEERVPPVFESSDWTTDYRLNYIPHKIKDMRAETYATWKKKQKAQRGEQELSDDEDSDMKSKYRSRDYSTRSRENSDPPMKSSYDINFVGVIAQPDSDEKRFPKNRLDMNTPDLSHLGIDLSKSRPPYREPQYRRVGTKRMCTWL